MARAPTRRLPPAPAGTAGKTRIMQLELEEFANRLHHLRTSKGWSQSDLGEPRGSSRPGLFTKWPKSWATPSRWSRTSMGCSRPSTLKRR